MKKSSKKRQRKRAKVKSEDEHRRRNFENLGMDELLEKILLCPSI